MMTMQVKQIAVLAYSESDFRGWEEFVAKHAEATFFHRIEWRRVISDGLRHRPYYLVAKMAGSIVGVLPLAEVKSRLFGHRLVSVPGCVYGGALGTSAEVVAALEAEACRLARSLNVAALELRHLRPSGAASAAGDARWQHKDLYVTFRKEISDQDDENLKAIPRKQRAMVRKGVGAGLTSELTKDVRRFYRIYCESVRNLGTPVFPFPYFELLQLVFGDDLEIAMVQHDGEDVACVMSFYFRAEVLPYYAGSRLAARALKANDFMYWDLMRRAVRRGVKTFDFGRSKLGSGSYSFKKNWGFHPEPLNYRYFLVATSSVPDVNPNNPKYRLFIEAWKRLPLPIANIVGPLLARNLG